MKILFLADELDNSKQWISAMEKFGNVKVEIWSLGKRGRIFRIFNWVFVALLGRYYFERKKYDLVIGYRTTSYGFLAARTGIRTLVIAAQGESDIWPTTGWTVPFKKIIYRYACKKADLIHAWGEHIKKSILETGADGSKVLVCPRGVDLTLFKFLPFNQKSERIPTFISTRSLYPEYQIAALVKAFDILNKLGVDFRFIICGDGSERKNIEKQIWELKLENKIFVKGRIINNNLPDYLAGSHYYISIPITEGVSASLLESMASGCIPIVSDLAANKLFIEDEKNGILINNFSPESISQRILKLIKRKSESLSEISYQNRLIVESKADLEKNILLFLENYQTLLNNK